VLADGGGPRARDAVVPRRADGEARAPRDAVVAVDALLPVGGVRVAGVRAGRVLGDPEVAVEPVLAARAAAGGRAALLGPGRGVVARGPVVVDGAGLGRHAQVVVAVLALGLVPALVLAEMPDLLAPVGQPVGVGLAPNLGLVVDGRLVPPHLALGDLHLLG